MRSLGVLAGTVALALLLAGCQSAPTDELDDVLSEIGGVASVHVDATRVKATLDGDIPAADAEAAIVALRDQAVAGHPLGADVELVVVVPAGERDLGDPQPWPVYSYGKWITGAVAADGFAAQAAFLARLADWESLTTTPAPIRQVRVEVTGVDSAGETPAPGEETAAPADPAAAPTVQVVDIRLSRWTPAGASSDGAEATPVADVDAAVAVLVAELAALWAESGGDPARVTIR